MANSRGPLSYTITALVVNIHFLNLQYLDSPISLLPYPYRDFLRDEHPAHAHPALLLLD